MTPSDPKTEFDRYAQDYDEALAQGIGISGETKDYFARERVRWLTGCLRRHNFQPRLVLDFGCGTGSATPHLLAQLGATHVLGVDISDGLLEVARREHGSERIQFVTLDRHQPQGEVDLVYCNGVFHHIPPPERAAALAHILRSLKPGGQFALWENNPLNPGTRFVMSRIRFDRDAVTLTAGQARRLLAAAGFEVTATSYRFIFPHFLRWLRWLEPLVCRLPLGAQYQVLARKPG